MIRGNTTTPFGETTAAGAKFFGSKISQLRKIFNDHPQQPRVIETILKVGYRLIAPVTKESAEQTGHARSGEAASGANVSVNLSLTRWQSTRLRIGLGALSAATLLLTLIICLLLITRSVGTNHIHLHH